jgi:hypothetical protein
MAIKLAIRLIAAILPVVNNKKKRNDIKRIAALKSSAPQFKTINQLPFLFRK